MKEEWDDRVSLFFNPKQSDGSKHWWPVTAYITKVREPDTICLVVEGYSTTYKELTSPSQAFIGLGL